MSDEWVMVPREPTEAMIRAGYSAPTVFGVRDMANTYRAMLAAAPDAPQRNREADRARYIDRAFNEWLDDSVADGGATVWDLVSDVHSAWAAWTAHPNYAAPAAPQQAKPRDVCDVCNALTVPRNATRYDADDLKAAQVRGKIIAARLPQQAEPVAQIGWSDEFGNLFPMAAWKPAQRTHHDSHKTAWRPVFLHPPAAEVQLLRDAVAKLSTIVRVPNAEHIADEHNAAVAFLRRALEGGE